MENIIGAADQEQQIEVPQPNQSSESVINRPKEKSLGVPTPFKGEVSLKRSAQEMSTEQRSSANKKSKLFGHEKEVISLADDEETSTNQVKGTLIEEETGQNVDSPQSDSQRTLSQHQISKGIEKVVAIDVDQEPLINLQHITYDPVGTSGYKSKEDLIKEFLDERSVASKESYELVKEAKKMEISKSSMIAMKEKDSGVFRIAITENSQVTQVKIQMEKIAIPDKINFHRQASEVLYSDLIKSYLNKQKMEEKMEILEQKNNRIKAFAQAWKGRVKQLEADLLAKTSDADRKKEMKKLLDEKDRLIEELKKKLKLEPADHPNTKEFMSL